MDDVLKHYRFSATLQLCTPLAVLEHHGETHPGPASELPRYGERRDGIWLPIVKSWAALAGPNVKPEVRQRLAKLAAEQVGTMASDVGPIPDDGGDYLPFLKAFRAIVESRESVESKRAKIAVLRAEGRFQQFAAIHRKRLDSWPLFVADSQ